jgi:hypothetical protein
MEGKQTEGNGTKGTEGRKEGKREKTEEMHNEKDGRKERKDGGRKSRKKKNRMTEVKGAKHKQIGFYTNPLHPLHLRVKAPTHIHTLNSMRIPHSYTHVYTHVYAFDDHLLHHFSRFPCLLFACPSLIFSNPSLLPPFKEGMQGK